MLKIALCALASSTAMAAVISGPDMSEFALRSLRAGAGTPIEASVAADPEAIEVSEEGCRLRMGEVAQPVTGNVRIPMHVDCASGKRQSRTVWVNVRRRVPVAVAARPLRRGERLRKEDLVEDMRWEDAPGGRALGIETAVGRELLRPLSVGDAVAESASRAVPDMRAGERIYLQVLAGALTVRAPAVALRDGYLGDTIEARLAQRGKVVSGRVAKGGILEIEMGRSRP